jgi:transposase
MTCDAAITGDLDTHGLAQASNLGKRVGDDGRGLLVPMPGHKLRERGRRLSAIGSSCPSGKTCRRRGRVKDAPDLSERAHVCGRRGHVLDRDRTPP